MGAGGMGEVYAAMDETLQRRVALKAIRVDKRLDDDARARFLREARLLSQLDHPNICRAYDYLREHDHDWLVLELIDGENLRDAINRGLGQPAKLHIARQIASVLVSTHEASIVHRDLKPGNVMLTRTGDVKVLDFGLARSEAAHAFVPASASAVLQSLAAADTELTQTMRGGGGESGEQAFQTRHDSISGTLAYMSPEQARGESATPASDMFSYGLVLQELFTGTRAYPGGLAPADLVARVQTARVEPIRGVSRDIAEFIRALTALAPSQRPTAVEAVARLRWIHDKPRRRIRRAAIAAVFLAAAAGAVKYTIDLRRERTVAVLAQQDADRRRAQAEDLIGFMLGDLRDKLTKVGRLELLEDVGTKAMNYFASVPAESLTGEELSRRVQTVYQIGAVRQARGDLKGATQSFQESLGLAKDLSGRNPANADWQLRLANAHFYLADALRFQGDLDGALRHLQEYRSIAQRLVDRDPSNADWLLELSYAEGGVAFIQESKGDFAGARASLEHALAIKQKLADRSPNRSERQQDLGVAHNRLGVVLDRMGEGDAALEQYLADLQIRDALVAREPTDQSIKEDLYVALSYVSRAYEDRGELQQAVSYAVRSIDLTSALAAVDPANADWQGDVALAESRLGGLRRWTGAGAEADQRYRSAVKIFGTLLQKAPANTTWRHSLAFAELGAGWVALDRGAAAAAASDAAAAAGVLAPAMADRKDAEGAMIASELHLLGAEAADRMRDPARMTRELDAALALSSSAVPDRRTLALRARTLLAMNRVDQARPIVEHLLATGYRHPALIASWRAHSRASRQ